jgi:hypothetical protein
MDGQTRVQQNQNRDERTDVRTFRVRVRSWLVPTQRQTGQRARDSAANPGRISSGDVKAASYGVETRQPIGPTTMRVSTIILFWLFPQARR